jgi:soluble lytic murein transglycosylase-like protein
MDILLAISFMVTEDTLNLPQGLLSSVCTIESNLNATAIHRHDGHGTSIGVCQIKIIAARHVGFKGTELDLMNPDTNIYFAGKYLKHQLKRYHNSVNKALIAYNMGSTKGLTQTKYSVKVIKQWRAACELKKQVALLMSVRT